MTQPKVQEDGPALKITPASNGDVVRVRLRDGSYSEVTGGAGGTFLQPWGVSLLRAGIAAVEYRDPFQRWGAIWTAR